MLTYEQNTGRIILNGALLAIGYSGNGKGYNNSAMQMVHKVGPIPEGIYYLGEPVDSLKHGKYFIPLIPDEGNEMHGRSGFGIHGDKIGAPGTASEGCIIAPKFARTRMKESGEKLYVVSGDPVPSVLGGEL